MNVYLTRHARNRMRLYGVSPEEVEQALSDAETVASGEFGRYHAWKQRGRAGWLRITFKDEGNRRVVITVTPKRQGPGGSDAH